MERFTQFIEQPRVLDGDDGLCSKILHQLDLLISKREDLLTENKNCTDHLLFFQHGYSKECANLTEFDGSSGDRFPVQIGRILAKIGDVNCLPGVCGPRDRKLRTCTEYIADPKPFLICGWTNAVSSR